MARLPLKPATGRLLTTARSCGCARRRVHLEDRHECPHRDPVIARQPTPVVQRGSSKRHPETGHRLLDHPHTCRGRPGASRRDGELSEQHLRTLVVAVLEDVTG